VIIYSLTNLNRLWAQKRLIRWKVSELIMANLNQNTNSFRDVGHIVKFNGDNHLDWKYEFLGMMEQLGLKNLIEPAVAGGQVLTLPIEVNHTFIHHVLNYLKPIHKNDILSIIILHFLCNESHTET
jgi:hypothetical protein